MRFGKGKWQKLKKQTSIGAIKASQERGKGGEISYLGWFPIVRYYSEPIG